MLLSGTWMQGPSLGAFGNLTRSRIPHAGLHGSMGSTCLPPVGPLSAVKAVGHVAMKQGGKGIWVTVPLESLTDPFQLQPFWVLFPAALVRASAESPRQ